jgi:hypothetical protein
VILRLSQLHYGPTFGHDEGSKVIALHTEVKIGKRASPGDQPHAGDAVHLSQRGTSTVDDLLATTPSS